MSDDFKTYRANAEGYDGDKIRVEGEAFTTNIPQGSWMDLLDKDGNVVERPKHTPAPGAAKAKGGKDAAADSGAIDALKAQLEGKLALVDERLAELNEKLAQATKPATEQPEPGPLDQSIPDLTTYLDTIGDVGAIDALIVAEKGGKSRSGALEALEVRKAALQGS